ncbi:MAG: adenylate/guanylate cyclase domain-containing protein [Acidimicrobiia bacterium]
MTELPSGTVTFLFTDLEGSTRLWEDNPDAMHGALTRHDEIVRSAIESQNGHVVKTTGDGFHAVFASAHDAIGAALAAQVTIEQEPWPELTRLRVRMGVHTGEAQQRAGDYYGSSTNRAARLMGVGHGGQIVVSDATAAVVGNDLADGVDLVPLGEHRLRDVATPIAIFQLVAVGLPSEFPALLTLDAFPENLPAQVSSFVGRERDVREIVGLLDAARVVTLTGVGGVGKTRLALQVASELQARFREGARLVELASVRDPGVVADAVAAALGAPTRPGIPVLDTLIEFVRPKQLLVVLDNCEHLLAPAAELVRTLEHACLQLVVLATSREGLGISGERLVAVRSLAESESEQLFVERAVAVKADFEVTDANAPAIAEVCRRLDGIPLAIELAAARVAALSPAQLAQRLDQRFRILAGGERGAIERHATLRAAIDWSYDLLASEEQLMLARLSVFAGGCTLEAAEATCAGEAIGPDDVLDLVSGLVMRSLVVADTDSAGDTYYRLLETIRQYAEECLEPQDRDATRDRHSRHFAEWLSVALAGSQGPEQAEWFARVDRDAENLRTAVSWAIAREDTPTAVELLATGTRSPLGTFTVGRAMLDSADAVLELVRATDLDRLTLVLAHAALLAAFRGDRGRAEQLCDEARAAADGPDDDDLYDVWAAEEWIALGAGDLARAVECTEHIVAWARRNGYDYEQAGMAGSLVMFRASAGDPGTGTGIANAREALALSRRTGAPASIASNLAFLAQTLVDSDAETARANLVEAMQWHDALGPAFAEEAALSTIAMVGARLAERAVTLRAAARILDRTPSSTLILGGVLENVAASVAPESPDGAAILHGAVDVLTPGLVQWGPLVVTRARAVEAIDAHVDPEAVARDREQGALMTEPEAADLARALVDEALSG